MKPGAGAGRREVRAASAVSRVVVRYRAGI
jgi:hypothetical protein